MIKIDLNSPEYLEAFREEALEVLESLENDLLNYEDNNNEEINKSIKRDFHTLKGNLAAYGKEKMSHYFHELESTWLEKKNRTENFISEVLLNITDIRDKVNTFIGFGEEEEEEEKIKEKIKEKIEEKIEEKKVKKKKVEKKEKITEEKKSEKKKTSKKEKVLKKDEKSKKVKKEKTKESMVEEKELSENNTKKKVSEDKNKKLLNIEVKKEEKLEVINKEEEGGFKIFNLLIDFKQEKIEDFHYEELIDVLNGEFEIVDINYLTEKAPEFEELDPETLYMDIEIILKAENKASIEELIGDLLDKKYFKITEIDSYEAKEKLKKVKKEPKNEKISEEKAEEKTEVKAEIKETVKKEIIIPEETGETAKKEMTTIRVNTVKLDNLVNIVGELIVAHSSLRTFKKSIVEDKLEDFEKIILDLDNITKSMQEDVLSVRMIPIGNTFVQFKRMIRDVSKKMSKKVKFEIKGGETEIDKTIIEKIVDPLRHMIRNSVDHGIEPTEERIKAGKSEEGVIKINAFHQGGEVIIEIFDDGKGLDKEALLKKAIEKKLISGYENLPDEEIYSLIFAPGFSTKEVVTELSGRGVGMDVVKNNIEELSGKVEIESEKGKYTMFKIRLPLTLAIIDGMLVRVGENIYVIPILSIAESFQPKETNIKKIQGKDDVLEIRGEYYPLIKLFKLFKIKESIEDPLKSTVLIIETHKGKIAMMVDEVVDNQQIVIKKLDLSHKEIDKFSGATILGTGEVALILDIKSIYDSMFRKIAGGEASE